MTMQEEAEALFSRKFEKPSDFLCCAFGLKDREIDAYFALLAGPLRISEMQKRIGGDRTTVQRVLKRLLEKGLAERETQQISRGGYYYVYKAISKEEVRLKVVKQLEIWYTATRRFLLEGWSEQPE